MNDIPIPEVLTRLPPSDVLSAIAQADIYLHPYERERLIYEMHRLIAENQERYRALRNAA